jgi:hypothetical protein
VTIQAETVPTSSLPVTLSAGGNATVEFVFFLGMSGSAPGISVVPVDIGVLGSALFSVSRGLGSGRGFSSIRVLRNPGPQAQLLFQIRTDQAANGDISGGFFSQTQQILMAPDEVIEIQLFAQYAVSASGGAIGSAVLGEAYVDPSFTIPQSFAERDRFSFVVSPNLLPVPEPAAALLVSLALVAPLGLRRRAALVVRSEGRSMPSAARAGGRSTRMNAQIRRFLIALGIVLFTAPVAALADGFEVWLVDQSNTNGLGYGGTLHIYDGEALSERDVSQARPVESIDLAALGGSNGLCFNATDPTGAGGGANPVRPHMILFNADHTRAVLSFVASGHVVIFDAAARTPLACFRMQAGAGGARQAHAAFPSPDGRSIVVANQNGKLLERIDADFARDVYAHTAAATLDLASCTTPNGVACQLAGVRPDNAPICPIVDSSGTRAFVTLRGGGLFVVDPRTTPMSIVAEYDAATVHGNGCGGVQAGDWIYLDSGGGTATNRSEFDVYRFPFSGYSAANPPNTPAPLVVFSDDYTSPTGDCQGDPNCRDAHGMALSNRSRTLWVADRHRNVFEVFDVATNARVNVKDVSFGGTVDTAPDLVDLAPGNRLVVSLRGPNPLSGDPHVATGSTPGIMVLALRDRGRDARITGIVRISNLDAGGVERADAHGIRVRSK